METRPGAERVGAAGAVVRAGAAGGGGSGAGAGGGAGVGSDPVGGGRDGMNTVSLSCWSGGSADIYLP
jgi:hypothetical protein